MSVNRDQIIKAIKATKAYKESDAYVDDKSTNLLAESEDFVFITASLYRIPNPKNTLPISM